MFVGMEQESAMFQQCLPQLGQGGIRPHRLGQLSHAIIKV
jgi:hypothetical protein